jgi:hypothetical protein
MGATASIITHMRISIDITLPPNIPSGTPMTSEPIMEIICLTVMPIKTLLL